MAVVVSAALQALIDSGDSPALEYARIGYEKKDGTASATSSSSGSPASSANNSLTYTFWKPSTIPATWTLEYGQDETINYLGIATHNMGTSGCTVAIQGYDGSTWSDIDSTTPTDDTQILFLFTDTAISRVRITISGGSEPKIGSVFTGNILVMERAMYGGHSPLALSRQTEYTTNKSENGQWLGRSVKVNGVATAYAWSNLTASWYREYFDPFVESARTQPFFIAWRPDLFPDEVGYCFTSGDIKPTNNSSRDLMNVSISAEGTY